MKPSGDWTTEARRELLRHRGAAGAWSYRDGAAPSIEPTALAGLGLLATRPEPGSVEDLAARAAGDWLASIQGADGSLGISQAEPKPGWTTPYAILLWQALGMHQDARRKGARRLLEVKGRAIPRSDDPEHVVGHDTTLIGWPWVADTHSWLEPTVLAVMALRREGYASHPRVREGLRLIVDRAIEGGGWNYGNKAAFGHPLRPQPAPTGQALLALAAGQGRPGVVDPAIRYLKAALPETRAAASLGWGLLGLRAWGEAPAGGEIWLAEAASRSLGRADGTTRLALLLLAAGDHSLEIFDGKRRGGPRG